MMSKNSFKILKEIGTIASYGTKDKILAIVSWNGAPAKYDIRIWDKKRIEPGPGIELDRLELDALNFSIKKILK